MIELVLRLALVRLELNIAVIKKNEYWNISGEQKLERERRESNKSEKGEKEKAVDDPVGASINKK